MDNFYQKLGAVMRQYRISRGLKVKDVADRLEIDAGNMSKYENGDRSADSYFLFRWARVLGMSARTNPFERLLEKEFGGRKAFRASE